MCPIREYEWVEGWEMDTIYTESGVGEVGSIFRFDTPPADGVGGPDHWIMTRMESPHRQTAVSITQYRVIIWEGFFESDGNGGTNARWEATMTALNEEGDKVVEAWDSGCADCWV